MKLYITYEIDTSSDTTPGELRAMLLPASDVFRQALAPCGKVRLSRVTANRAARQVPDDPALAALVVEAAAR